MNNYKSFIMKKNILTFVFMLFFSFLFSQQKVALESSGTTTIFGGSNPFLDAYNAAVDGDIIYLPGATMSGFTIDKGITIIGAGHYPSATVATNPTLINGNITINANADGLTLEGIHFSGGITFGTNMEINDVTIKRCRIDGSIDFAANSSGTTPCKDGLIAENIIVGNLTMSNLINSAITNNIFNGVLSNGSNNGISNNIFLYNSVSYTLNNIDNSFITNNIFFENNGVAGGCDMSTFSHNVFKYTPAIGNSTFTSNYNDIDFTNLMINQSGTTFDYAQDYHLQSPSTYLGTDGSQVSIYGGVFVFKDLAIPHNPHIISKTIATQTNAAGELPIQITVEAQNN